MRSAGPTARRRAQRRRELTAAERAAKEKVRDRDKHCRFPRCGCISGGYSMKDILTVSHDRHKGMGGDPTGEKSQPELMLSLCKWRHQDAPVSKHAGTMRTRYLTLEKNNGPLLFEVDLAAVYPGMHANKGIWYVVATETDIGVLAPLNGEQERVLEDLAEMTR